MSIPLIQSPQLSVPHGFTTRQGGVSQGSYAGLNLDDRQDCPKDVAHNRQQLAAAFGATSEQFARLNQVHGTEVITVQQAGIWEGDALVTSTPNILLAVGTADCYPLLLADPQSGVIGAAHAGWKGTVGHIAGRTVKAMEALGAKASCIQAAIGPGICGQRYQVGQEVAQQFKEQGLGEHVLTSDDQVHVDLASANQAVLEQVGVQQIWQSGRCSTESDFYSYRRDQGQTGRMWAVITLPSLLTGGQ